MPVQAEVVGAGGELAFLGEEKADRVSHNRAKELVATGAEVDGITVLSNPAASSPACGPTFARRAHFPQRRISASPAVTFTPVFFSHASKSAGKMRVPGSRYGTPFSLGMS